MTKETPKRSERVRKSLAETFQQPEDKLLTPKIMRAVKNKEGTGGVEPVNLGQIVTGMREPTETEELLIKNAVEREKMTQRWNKRRIR